MRVAFCVHPDLPKANEQEALCKTWLSERGVASIKVDTGRLGLDAGDLEQLAEQLADVSLVCALGGDGTILRAARLAYALETPALGANFGNLGFLSGVSEGELLPALDAFLSGELLRDQRVMLEATASFSDGSMATYTALNEVLLGRSDIGKVIVVDIAINGHRLPSPRGDGVIVATATGSTGYAHSAGGPLLTPENRGLCIVPISCVGFYASALVSAPTDTIELTAQPHRGQQPLLCVDGLPLNTFGEKRTISSVVVRKAARDMVFLRYDGPDFYTRIAHSLAGGSHAG